MALQLQHRLPKPTLLQLVGVEKATVFMGLKEDSLLNDGVFRATSTCTVLTHGISGGDYCRMGKLKGWERNR
jgi:hypothetical protein